MFLPCNHFDAFAHDTKHLNARTVKKKQCSSNLQHPSNSICDMCLQKKSLIFFSTIRCCLASKPSFSLSSTFHTVFLTEIRSAPLPSFFCIAFGSVVNYLHHRQLASTFLFSQISVKCYLSCTNATFMPLLNLLNPMTDKTKRLYLFIMMSTVTWSLGGARLWSAVTTRSIMLVVKSLPLDPSLAECMC